MAAAALSFENLVKRSCNYLDRIINGTGLPYFNVFYTHQTQAYSDFDNRLVPVYYGEPGPVRLYQQRGYLAHAAPQTKPLWISSYPCQWW